MTTVLAIGSTGQVGRVVVEEALARGLTVRAQTRSAGGRARRTLPEGVEIVEASPVAADDLRPHVSGVDAVVLTHGGDTDGDGSSFYAVIPALLDALDGDSAHISLMTAMNTSHSAGPSRYGFVEWKRRAERLVRASGPPTRSCGPAGSTTRGRMAGASICVRATSSPAGPAWTAATSPRSSWRVSSTPPGHGARSRSSAPPGRP